MEFVKQSIDERAQHKREYDRRVNDRQMQTKERKVDMGMTLDVGLIVTACSRTKSDKQDTSSVTPPPSVDYPASEVVALIHKVEAPVSAVSTGSPSSTNVDQDAPSPSNSQTTPKTQPPIIPNNVEEDNHDIE
ncbi:hypothetical protein Tco_1104255 [Tanacetum coccineum]